MISKHKRQCTLTNQMSIICYQAALYWIAAGYQQYFYEVSCDWNHYNEDEHLYLKKFIGHAIYGLPSYDDIQGPDENAEDRMYNYKTKGAEQTIQAIYKKIVEHGTQQTLGNKVLCNVVYNCWYREDLISNFSESNMRELITITPVFKVENNITNGNSQNESDNKIWYIDVEARVYKSWSKYLENNNLSTCTMIVPKDGIYKADLKEVWSEDSTPVWVEVQSHKSYKMVTETIDKASIILNAGCIGVGITSLFTPIGPVVAAASEPFLILVCVIAISSTILFVIISSVIIVGIFI